MKIGTVLNIKPSEALSLMRLNMLIGKEAIIVQDLTSIERLNKGYMVELVEPIWMKSIGLFHRNP